MAEHEQLEIANAIDGVRQLKKINDEVWEVLDRAKDQEEDALVLAATDRVLRQLEHQAKITGEIDDSPNVNILVAPIVTHTIIQALDPYPEAKWAVAGALKALGQAEVTDD